MQRLVDSVKTAYALGSKTFIVTKAYGGAAQSGIAEAMRIALRRDKQFIILPDLADAVELLKPDKVLLITYDFSKHVFDPKEFKNNERILLVVSGSNPEFSSSEMKLGEPVYFENIPGKIGPIGELTLAFYILSRSGVG